MKKKKKLIIIGIDGGTFNVIDPLFKQGKLPNLKSFKNSAVLKSTMPPGTAVSWASFITGNNTGKTGIFDFTIVDDDSWKIRFINKNALRSRPLWKYLDEKKLKSYFINLPVTYPPDKINGVLVSGIDAPSTLANYTYPKDVKNKLKKFDYQIEVSGLKDKNLVSKQAIEVLDKRLLAANYFIKKDFDFFVVLFRASDVAQHYAWGKKDVVEIYEKIDEFIGHVKKKFKDKADIIIMSDHGSEKVDKGFNINVWLENEGYLSTKVKKQSVLSTLGINRERIFKIIERFRLDFLIKMVPRKLGKKIPTKQVDFEEAIITKMVDFNKTRAIAKRAVKSAQIFINNENRKGIVRKEHEDKLVSEITHKLKKYLAKNKIKAEIKTKSELYGKDSKNAPEITLYLKEKGYDILTFIKADKKLWDKTKEQATHNTEGVIFSDLDLKLESPRIIDFTPTILDYFDIEKGKFDGKSLL